MQFIFELPEYSTADVVHDRLNYAIDACTSIDGDENMNEALEPRRFNED
jgi:hypothetical protein